MAVVTVTVATSPKAQSAAAGTTLPANALMVGEEPLTLLAQRRRKSKQRQKRQLPRSRPNSRTKAPPSAPLEEIKPLPELPTGYKAVAILPFDTQDVSPELIGLIENSLLAEIDDRTGMRGVAPQDVETDAVESGLAIAECGVALACLAKIGRYARAHLLIETRLAALGGTLSIAMRLIDTQTGEEIERVGDPLSEDKVKRAQELNALMLQLLAPEEYTGSLVVKTSVPGAAIYLNEKFIGNTPMKQPVANLKGGPHILRISKIGFRDIYQFVDVVHHRQSTIDVDLATNTIAGRIVEEASERGYGAVYIDTDASDIDIRIDGEPRGVTPMAGPITKLAAGARRITFRKPGHEPQTIQVDVLAGKRVDLNVIETPEGLVAKVLQTVDEKAPMPGQEPQPIATSLADADDPEVLLGRVYGWRTSAGVVTAGVGVAGLIAGALLASQVGSRQRRANEIAAHASDPLFPSQIDALQNDLQTIHRQAYALERGQWIALGTGGGLALVGGGLVLWDLLRGDMLRESGPAGGVEQGSSGLSSVAPQFFFGRLGAWGALSWRW